MGMYINQTSKQNMGSSFEEKCEALERDGAVLDPDNGTKFKENLVCVIDNGPFAAAAYCYSEGEWQYFWLGRQGRDWKWYVWDKVKEFAQ